jgi:hypothetical protein
MGASLEALVDRAQETGDHRVLAAGPALLEVGGEPSQFVVYLGGRVTGHGPAASGEHAQFHAARIGPIA